MSTVSQVPELGRNWWLFLVVGLVSVVAGVLAIVYPDITLLALGIFAGVGLLFSGAMDIAEAISGAPESRVLAAIVGVLSVVAGLICLRRPGESLLAILVVLGIYLVVAGIARGAVRDLAARAGRVHGRRRVQAPRVATPRRARCGGSRVMP